MIKSYRYKLAPTTKQKEALIQAFGCARYVYNWGLDLKMRAYKSEGKNISYNEMSHMLVLLKKGEDYKWLNQAGTCVLQQSLRNLDMAFIKFFKGCKNKTKVGFPKFKSKHRDVNTIKFCGVGTNIDFNTWRVRILKIGWIKIQYNKPFDLYKVKLGTFIVSQDKCGDFWCSINVETGNSLPPKAKVEADKTLGIDLGLKSFITMSNGITVSNPKFYEKALSRLKFLQRRLSIRHPGSNRRERARIALARLHRHVANCRKDFIHKLTSSLVKSDYTSFAVENLDIIDLEKNRAFAAAVGTASWNEFIRQLKYKADWAGKNVLQIDQFAPSSKTCNICGWINKDLTIADREWVCPKCGTVHDRDINAAINIKQFALFNNGNLSPCVGGVTDEKVKDYDLCKSSKSIDDSLNFKYLTT